MIMMVYVQIAVSLLAILGCVCADDPVVEVKTGQLVGKAVEFSHKDVDAKRTVHVFKGVPYAEPPVGDLRFRPPVAKAPWDGVHNATAFGSACIQPSFPQFPIQEPLNEDCLFLNIYAPQTSDSKLPVMVWLHGGALVLGSAGNLYEGTALAAIGDVVVVTINYRLGPLGFLTTGDEHATGNYGFLDQIAALQWTQDNIAAFGGDVDRVTVFGESAGGISGEYLTLSPLTKGLFHRVILQSGISTMGFGGYDKTVQKTIAHGLGKLVGCEKETVEELVQCLRTVPAEDFIDPTDTTKGQLANVTGLSGDIAMFPFPPVVDDKVVTAPPADTLREKNFPRTDVDIMMGALSDEGRLILLQVVPDAMNDTEVTLNRTQYEESFSLFLPEAMRENPTVLEAANLVYTNWDEYDDDSADYADTFSQLHGDRFVVCPAQMSARAYAQAGLKVYFYFMTHVPTKPLWNITWAKASHGEELPFMFGWHFEEAMNWTMSEVDVAMSLKLIKYWTNFAKTGNPNLSSGDAAESQEDDWPLFTVPGLAYRELSTKMENKRALKTRECALWNDFVPKVIDRSDGDATCSKSDDETKKYTEEENLGQ